VQFFAKKGILKNKTEKKFQQQQHPLCTCFFATFFFTTFFFAVFFSVAIFTTG
jgi:hypothetical protein